MGILSGNPKDEPLHYGEVFGMWTYLFTAKAMMANCQTFLNHAGDKDLKALLEDMIQTQKKEIAQVEELLKANGVALPPTPPDRPKAALENIPVGARFNDNEIATALGSELAAGLVACSQIIGQSVREDVPAMFMDFHTNKAQFGLRTLRLTKEKGWLIPPPLHLKAPELAPV
ncbi:DUF3231 family protein [Brevibacillus fulvus]|uniref:DUF3231 family protein n=1 Tax=Brevibacillus fulvus TaxID=1125967 RepID=A0A939BS77_9BACL|nr:DUF3231 family protein [Brevibacillus fulvus]MBM7590417.1 hypothetical protein [Brevibacillus fulvus]